MQLDVASAFGFIDRDMAFRTILTALQARGPLPPWLPWLRNDLAQPTTFDGIAQGDPTSALIFGAELAIHVTDLTELPFLGIYFDDIVVATSIDEGLNLLRRLSAHLALLGLALQPEKTKTLLPPEMPPEQLAHPELQTVRDTFSAGLKICGQAFDGCLEICTPYGRDQRATQVLQDEALQSTSQGICSRNIITLRGVSGVVLPLVYFPTLDLHLSPLLHKSGRLAIITPNACDNSTLVCSGKSFGNHVGAQSAKKSGVNRIGDPQRTSSSFFQLSLFAGFQRAFGGMDPYSPVALRQTSGAKKDPPGKHFTQTLPRISEQFESITL